MHFDKSSKKSIKYREECGAFWDARCGVWGVGEVLLNIFQKDTKQA